MPRIIKSNVLIEDSYLNFLGLSFLRRFYDLFLHIAQNAFDFRFLLPSIFDFLEFFWNYLSRMLFLLWITLQLSFILLFDLIMMLLLIFGSLLIVLNVLSMFFTFYSCHLPQFFIFPVDLSLLFLIHLIFLLLFIDQIFEKIFRIYYTLSFVEILYILESLHQFHFSLRIIRFIFEVLHRIFLFLMHLQPFQVLFGLLCIFNSLIVSRTSCLYNIIMVFGVSFKCDFTVAIGTFEVETKNLDTEIGLFVTNFHSHVKFGTDVEIVGAGIAP